MGQQGANYDPLNPPPPPAVPELHSLREFLDQMTETSPLGVELREDHTSLRSGETISGLARDQRRGGQPGRACWAASLQWGHARRAGRRHDGGDAGFPARDRSAYQS